MRERVELGLGEGRVVVGGVGPLQQRGHGVSAGGASSSFSAATNPWAANVTRYFEPVA